MKRFTETTKWRDPWYRRLTPTAKLLWSYLTDNCDCTGLIDLDLDAAAFDIGAKVNEKHLAELESRTQRTIDGKIFIPRFISFQYGFLSGGCPAHKPVIKLVTERNLSINGKGYQYPINTLAVGLPNSTGKGKEKEKDKEEEKDSTVNKANGLVDSEWIARLCQDKTYAGIDVRRELGKACNWCEVKGFTITRRRFINWLNRAEKPITAPKIQPLDKSQAPVAERFKAWVAEHYPDRREDAMKWQTWADVPNNGLRQEWWAEEKAKLPGGIGSMI